MPAGEYHHASPTATNISWCDRVQKYESLRPSGVKFVTRPHPTSKHTHTFIFLHGKNQDALLQMATNLHGASTSLNHSLVQLFPTFRWVYPSSTQFFCECTFPDEYQWFHVCSDERLKDFSGGIKRAGLRNSVANIVQLIREEAEMDGIGYDNIILGGMDQGAAVAIWSLMAMGVKLGGFVSIGGYLPCASTVMEISKLPLSRRTTQIQNVVFNKWGNEAARVAFSGYATMKYYLKSHTVLFDLAALGVEHDAKESLSIHTPAFVYHCQNDDVVPIRDGLELTNCMKKFGFLFCAVSHVEGGHWLNKPSGVDSLVGWLTLIMKLKKKREEDIEAWRTITGDDAGKKAGDKVTLKQFGPVAVEEGANEWKDVAGVTVRMEGS